MKNQDEITYGNLIGTPNQPVDPPALKTSAGDLKINSYTQNPAVKKIPTAETPGRIMANKWIWIAVAVVAVWYFFLRGK